MPYPSGPLKSSTYVLSNWLFQKILNFYYVKPVLKVEYFSKYATWQYLSWVVIQYNIQLEWTRWMSPKYNIAIIFDDVY